MSAFTDMQTLREEVGRRIGSIEHDKLQPAQDQVTDTARDVLDEFNRIRPQLFVHQEQGNGAKRRFVLSTTITNWDDGLSEVLEVELVEEPDSDDERVRPIDDEQWEIRQDTAGNRVLFVRDAPGSDQYLRILWTLPHTIQDLDAGTATTISAKHKAVFVLLMGAELCELIGRKASDLADHSLGVDQVDFRTYEERWKDNAKRLHERARERLVPSRLSTGAAGTFTEWETRSRLGRRRVAH